MSDLYSKSNFPLINILQLLVGMYTPSEFDTAYHGMARKLLYKVKHRHVSSILKDETLMSSDNNF